MLATLPVPTTVAGNIGYALSKELEHMGPESYVAAELSSFQLEGMTTFHPQIACIVNITPDHFERHGNMETTSTPRLRFCPSNGRGCAGLEL